jgi:hypothetical protein
MLTELDEDTAILLQHLERTLSASLVACLEHLILLLQAFNGVSRV